MSNSGDKIINLLVRKHKLACLDIGYPENFRIAAPATYSLY
jgi:hypothetical protein